MAGDNLSGQADILPADSTTPAHPASPAMTNPEALDGFALSCPGNLLLAGEYAVLEEGGLGICLAPDLRAWLVAFPPSTEPQFTNFSPSVSTAPPLASAHPAPPASPVRPLRIFAVQTPGEEPRLIHQVSGSSGFLQDALVQAIIDVLSESGAGIESSFPAGWDLLVDTSAFHDSSGRKLGLGSSAASCLLLTAALARLSGIDQAKAESGPRDDKDFIPRIAVEAHRKFQGGKGSGYDIWTSWRGGISVFSGGRIPQATSLPGLSAQVPPFRLLKGEKAQKTVSAIALWTAWRQGEVKAAQHYVEACKARGESALAARTWKEVEALLGQAREDGIALGAAIGCPAEFHEAGLSSPEEHLETSQTNPGLVKATGAGCENAIAFPPFTPVVKPGVGVQAWKAGEADLASPTCITAAEAAEEAVGEAPMPGDSLADLAVNTTATGPGNKPRLATAGLLQVGSGFLVHPVALGTGRAKLTLFGEHTALDGWPACGIGLDEELKLAAVLPGTNQSGQDQSGGNIPRLPPSPIPPYSHLPSHAHLPKAFREALTRLETSEAGSLLDLSGPVDSPACVIFALSEVPLGGGFGSSAALSLALVRLSWNLSGKTGDQSQVWAEANTLDSVFHGRASGMDTGLGLSRGLRILRPAPAPSFLPAPRADSPIDSPTVSPAGSPAGNSEAPPAAAPLIPPRFILAPLVPPYGIWLVHAGLRRTGNTRDLVAALRKNLVLEGPLGESARTTYRQLANVASRACEVLAGSACAGPARTVSVCLQDLATLTDQAQDCLDHLGLVSDECRQVLYLARAHGSLAGKMSGAGGGGAFWCLCADETSARELAAWLNEGSGLPGLASLARVTVI